MHRPAHRPMERFWNSRLTRTLALVALLVSVAAARARRPAQDALSPAAAREELRAMYAVWGRARVDVDRETLEALLAPDFRLVVDGKTSSGAEFLDVVTAATPGVRLARFDVELLTLQPTGKGWTAVIAEKLEWETKGADGKPQRTSNLWVTRDACAKEGGEWRFHSSEALGVESWAPGVKPPLAAW